MKKRFVILVIIFSMLASNVFMEQLSPDIQGYVPPDGFIPDEKTAKKNCRGSMAANIWKTGVTAKAL
jgi:hypothetical protein